MTTPGTPSFDKETTFLVSREGIAIPKTIPNSIDPIVGARWLQTGKIDGGAENENETAVLRIAQRLAGDAFASRPPKGNIRRSQVIKIPAALAAVDGFSRIASSCLAQISVSAQLVRTGSDRDALHQTRVGLRRLRAAFTVFKEILPVDELDLWKRETKWLAGELDGARELDVFITQISLLKTKKSRRDPAWTMFGSRLLMMRAAAYEEALAAIESERFATLLRECTEWANAVTCVPTESGEAINLRDGDSSVLARRALKRLHCRVHKAGHHLVKLDTAGRHGARIGTKKLRYAAEFFSTTFGRGEDKRHSHYIATLATLQSALGDLNDLAMIQKCACAVAGRSMELAFHAGQIIGNQKAEQTRLLVKSVHAYRHWREAKPFWH